MARATRSTVAQEKDKQGDNSSSASRGKAASKKRKRSSIAENDDQPATKQLRSGDVTIKEEAASQEPEDKLRQVVLPQLQITGDVPIDAGDAQKILDILEMIDTQGLLDRVFPLPSNPTEASGSQPASYSFRTLLKESSQHPLCVLRCAVQHLFPISSHPRARPSTPAAQQLSFCTLALSLLDQASFHSVQIPLDLESILPLAPQSQDATDDITDTKSDVKSKSPSHHSSSEVPQLPTLKRKYALMQKLSGGEWWTSLNSEFGPPFVDGKALKDLPTAHAELVAILPSPSTSASKPDPSVPIPNLGSYAANKNPWPKAKALGPRHASCGKFLDYGPYASFAPSFEGNGVEVGRKALGETIWRWEEQRRSREIELKQGSIVEVGKEADVEMDDVQEINSGDPRQTASNEDVEKATVEGLDGLLPPAEIAAIKAALDTLELEDAVDELLGRNKRALVRLEELQRLRLGSEGGGTSEVEEGSEEWDTAQAILNSLTILTSLRPRSSKDTAETPPLIPPASVLRKLHRTIPITPTQGWYGALPPTRPTALRDDSTIRIRSGVVVPAAAESAPATPGPANPATGASPYAYPGYSAQPFRGAYPQQQYKPGQPFYPGQYGVQPQAQGQPQAAGMAQYYPNQPYGQGQYQYPSLFYQTAQGQAANLVAAAASNGHAVPQPAGATTTGYGGFYNYNTSQQQQAQRAVANTVLTAAAAKQGVNGTVPTTLPSHLRNTTWGAGSASQPSTPGGAGSGNQQNYHGSYQPTPTR